MQWQLRRKRLFQRFMLSLMIALLILTLAWLGKTLFPPQLPTSQNPILFYSNELNSDLKEALLHSIEEAKESILVIVYTLNDDAIISALKRKSDSGVQVRVIVDRAGFKKSIKRLGDKTILIKRKSPGIMHQKVIVIDKKLVWLGSANLTHDSLGLHYNLMNAIYHPPLAEKFWQRQEKMKEKGDVPHFEPYHFKAGPNIVTLYITPDPFGAEREIARQIDNAKKSIKLALFTWTHNNLRKHVQEAVRRGVEVEVILDAGQSKSTHLETVKKLYTKGIKVGVNQHEGLMHHKMAWIDDSVLIHGSLNWTISAFTKNDDLFIIVEDLTDIQKKEINDMWKVLEKKTKWLTNEDWIDWIRQDGQESRVAWNRTWLFNRCPLCPIAA